MKKAVFTAISLVFLIISISFVAWNSKAFIFKYLVSKQLNNVPVNLGKLMISESGIEIEDFLIGNFPSSKTGISFGAKQIAINTNLKAFSSEPFVISSLTLKDTTIAIEFYNESGSKNNWENILKEESKSIWPITKDYLIRKIALEKLIIQVTDHNGKLTKYPIIDKLEFYNIGSNMGFPINKIDKVVLNTILRAVFSRLGYDNLLDQANWNKVVIPHFSTNSPKENEN